VTAQTRLKQPLPFNPFAFKVEIEQRLLLERQIIADSIVYY